MDLLAPNQPITAKMEGGGCEGIAFILSIELRQKEKQTMGSIGLLVLEGLHIDFVIH